MPAANVAIRSSGCLDANPMLRAPTESMQMIKENATRIVCVCRCDASTGSGGNVPANGTTQSNTATKRAEIAGSFPVRLIMVLNSAANVQCASAGAVGSVDEA